MKEESVIAFLTKNKRNFKVSDYSIIRKELNTINDNQFSLLMNTSFAQGWWITLSIVLFAVAVFWFSGFLTIVLQYDYFSIDIILSILYLILSILSLCAGFYILLDIRKRYALKQFLALVKSLTIN